MVSNLQTGSVWDGEAFIDQDGAGPCDGGGTGGGVDDGCVGWLLWEGEWEEEEAEEATQRHQVMRLLLLDHFFSWVLVIGEGDVMRLVGGRSSGQHWA